MKELTDEQLLSKIDQIVEAHRNPNYNIGGISLGVIIQGLIVMGIAGLFVKIDTNTKKSIEREVQIQNIRENINDIKKGMEKNALRLDDFRSIPNYTRQDLKEDLAPIEAKLNSIEQDVNLLKTKIR